MNGGIFVCIVKGARFHQVEKVLTPCQYTDLAIREVKFAHRCRHAALTNFVEGYISRDHKDISLWVEFCDRGSLDDIMKNYIKHVDEKPTPQIPEAFMWHVFYAMVDALYYLETGNSISERDAGRPKDQSWVPLLHRDIKPDNIFFRSRSGLQGGNEKRYYYAILSDFGLMVCVVHASILKILISNDSKL